MNVRYSAQRLLSHSPTISAASSAAKASSTNAEDAQVRRGVLEGPAEVAEEAARLGGAGRPAGQIVHDVLVVVMEGLVVRGEGEQRDGQPGQHNDVNGAVDGNEAQDVAVAQGGAAQREVDLVPCLDPLAVRLRRRRPPDPVVAAQAAVPAHVAVLAHQQRVVGRDGGGVQADQDVAGPGAGEELVAVRGSAAARHAVRLSTAPRVGL